MSQAVAQGTPVRVVLFGFNERNESMMRQLFAGARWRDCLLVESEPADFAIVELDTPNPSKTWELFRHAFPHTLALVLSIREQAKNNALFLQKPMNMEKLRQSIDEIKDFLAKKAAESSVNTPVPRQDVEKLTAQGAANKMASEADNQLFGDVNEIDLKDKSARKTRVYNPNNYFLGELKKAVIQANNTGKSLQITGSLYGKALPGAIRIIPQLGCVEVGLKDIMLRAMSIVRLDSEQIKLTTKELNEPLPQATTEFTKALLWKVALWTARGRLTSNIDFDQKVSLKNWPNITCYMEIPYALQLTAALVAAPHTPVELCEKLGIPQRFVFSYLSAINANQLLSFDTFTGTSSAMNTKRPLRRFLSKVLERLTVDAAS